MAQRSLVLTSTIHPARVSYHRSTMTQTTPIFILSQLELQHLLRHQPGFGKIRCLKGTFSRASPLSMQIMEQQSETAERLSGPQMAARAGRGKPAGQQSTSRAFSLPMSALGLQSAGQSQAITGRS